MNPLFIYFQNFKKLQHSPPIKASEWCEKQPCVECGDWIISQPSSSLIVFLLSFYGLWVGYHYIKTQEGHQSRYWFGISMLLGGIGGLSAGLSYQLLGYEIKCAGRAFCMLTSWWEIIYFVLTVAAAGALLISISHIGFGKKIQSWSRNYAIGSTLLYLCCCLSGAFLPNKFLVSFDFMMLYTMPAYLIVLPLHLYFYYKQRSILLKRFLICWFLLVVVILAQNFYLEMGYTEILWAKGIWFSENDVFHILMLFWCFYVHLFLSKYIKDIDSLTPVT
jgi:hypothetical protein